MARKTPFEVIVGAILTQNTSWTNVERAIANLRRARLLTRAAIERSSPSTIEALIRPSGYFRQKARKLKAFCSFLRYEYSGSLKKMFAEPTAVLREKLLGVFGIGPEQQTDSPLRRWPSGLRSRCIYKEAAGEARMGEGTGSV